MGTTCAKKISSYSLATWKNHASNKNTEEADETCHTDILETNIMSRMIFEYFKTCL